MDYLYNSTAWAVATVASATERKGKENKVRKWARALKQTSETNNDPDQDQNQATTTLPHESTTMLQFATTTTAHGSMLMEHVQHQQFENGHDEFPNHFSNSDSECKYIQYM